MLETTEGYTVPGYFVCCALAAMRSAAAPHQPLTRVAINGFLKPSRTLMFSRHDLNTIAKGGTWIVTANDEGVVFTRHQLTTDRTSESTEEDSITTNLDAISRFYWEMFEPVYGRSNNTDEMLNILRNKLFIGFKTIHNISYSKYLGPQMIGYKLLKLERDQVRRTHVIMEVEPELPYPLNNLTLKFYIR